MSRHFGIDLPEDKENTPKLEVEIYDGETFDRKEILDLEKEKGFMVKFGKKTKLLE